MMPTILPVMMCSMLRSQTRYVDDDDDDERRWGRSTLDSENPNMTTTETTAPLALLVDNAAEASRTHEGRRTSGGGTAQLRRWNPLTGQNVASSKTPYRNLERPTSSVCCWATSGCRQVRPQTTANSRLKNLATLATGWGWGCTFASMEQIQLSTKPIALSGR